MPQLGIILLENEALSSVYGTSAGAFQTTEADAYQLANNYSAVSHPSLPNYCALTAGSLLGKAGTDSMSGLPVDAHNIFHQLEVAGFTWKEYAQGFVAGSSLYVAHHDPAAFYTTTAGSADHVDFSGSSGLMADIAAATLPDFYFISPNKNNDGHDTGVAYADHWLQGLNPGGDSPAFPGLEALIAAMRSDGIVIVVYDEGVGTAGAGGGLVYCLLAGQSKAGASKFTQAANHYGLLASIQKLFGVGRFSSTNTSFPLASAYTSSSLTLLPLGSGTGGTTGGGGTGGTGTGAGTITYAYQWYSSSDGGATADPISGATTQNLVVDSTLFGLLVKCTVAATDNYGTSYADTPWSSAVTTTSGAPVATVAPVVQPMNPVAGKAEFTTYGTWDGDPTAYTFQWQEMAPDGTVTAISGATTPTFIPDASLEGYAFACDVTATNGTGSTTVRSNWTNPQDSTPGAWLFPEPQALPGLQAGTGSSTVAWDIRLFDQDNNYIGPLRGAFNRKMTFILNGLDQCTFSLYLDDELAPFVLSCESRIRVWRSIYDPWRGITYSDPFELPCFAGYVAGVDRSGQNDQMDVTCFSPLWMLQARYHVEPSNYLNEDPSAVMWDLIHRTNHLGVTFLPGFEDHTGIVGPPNIDWPTYGSWATYNPPLGIDYPAPRGKQTWQAITDILSMAPTNFDPEAIPGEGMPDLVPLYAMSSSQPWDQHRRMMFFNTAVVRGVRPDATTVRFEYRTGLENCDDMSWRTVVDPGTFATWVTLQGQGDTDQFRVDYPKAGDAAAIADIDRYGLYMKWVKYPNVKSTFDLRGYAKANFARSRRPVQVYQPTLAPNELSPYWHYDWDLGDVVQISADRGAMAFSGREQRIYQVDISISENNLETAQPTMAKDFLGVVPPSA